MIVPRGRVTVGWEGEKGYGRVKAKERVKWVRKCIWEGWVKGRGKRDERGEE